MDTLLAVYDDLYGAFGHLQAYGTEGADSAKFTDTFFAFKTQLEAYVSYLRTGTQPFPFEETVEQMSIIIAGIESRKQGGKTIHLKEH